MLNGLVSECHFKSKQPDHSKSDQNGCHLGFYLLFWFGMVKSAGGGVGGGGDVGFIGEEQVCLELNIMTIRAY